MWNVMWWVSKESLRPWLRLTVTLPYIWLVERSAGLHWCKDIYCAPVSIREVKTCDLWVPADQTTSELLFMWVQIYFGRLKCKESLMLFFIVSVTGRSSSTAGEVMCQWSSQVITRRWTVWMLKTDSSSAAPETGQPGSERLYASGSLCDAQ